MKVLRVSSFVVLALACLSLYGNAVRSLTMGKDIGFLSAPITWLSELPDLIVEVLQSNEIRGMAPTHIQMEGSGTTSTELDYDVYGLSPVYDFEAEHWEINLFNFKNDEVLHNWYLYKDDFVQTTNRKFENAEPRNPILLPGRELITNNDETNSLYRLDANSNILWKNDKRYFHHSMNLGPGGNIWICGTGERLISDYRDGGPFQFRDELLLQIDVDDGEIMYEKSVADLLMENGYANFIYGSSNAVTPGVERDPIHLNDIQPVLADGKFWKKGDLLLSLRNKSLILLYRPSSNKIVRLIYGPFLHQHDVDIISETEISLFNNNYTDLGAEAKENVPPGLEVSDSLISSQILIYNFEDSSYTSFAQNVFEENEIATRTEGFHEFLSTGDVYVESQNQGKVYIMNGQKILVEKTFETTIQDIIELPHWIRIYENVDF